MLCYENKRIQGPLFSYLISIMMEWGWDANKNKVFNNGPYPYRLSLNNYLYK
jgi:hypothetical protein